ncbi:MAG: hypothetical protein JSS44_13545 [Proteobacteria bacterium]|nr:hypothetical protein [Pseudomonadota bacterium]
MSNRKLLVWLCLLLCSLMQGARADTGFDPIDFWNVPNWISNGDFQSVRYPSGDAAIRGQWASFNLTCAQLGPVGAVNGPYQAELADTYPVITGAYPYWNDSLVAYHYNLLDCATGQISGPYLGGSSARRYVSCPGTGQPIDAAYDPRGLWAAMWPNTNQTGCFTAYYVRMSLPDDPKVGCPNCNIQGRAGTGDPVEISTGNMYLRETDYVSADPRLQFSRIYNSSQSGYVSTTIGNGWQGELDGMHVLSMKGALPQRARFYAEVSSMYTNASDACVKGVAEVVGGGAGGKPDPQWKGVTGTYDGAGHCNLSNGTSIPVLGTGGQQGLAGAIDVVGRGFGLRLKDGTVHALYCNQGVCSMPGYAGTTPYTITIDTSGFHVAAEDGSVQFYDYLV